MGKKLRSFLTIVLIAVGGGMVYVASPSVFGANADSAALTNGDVSVIALAFMIAGVIMISSGLMIAVFTLASSSGRRS